ncbi:MAG: TGS domain-containing protein, partial [Bacilli bacterium]
MSVKMQVNVTFPDGAVKGYDAGTTIEDVAQSISPGLRKKAIAGKLNGNVVDLNRTIEEDSSIEIITLDQPEGLGVLRHSTAHLLAQAVKRLYPNAKFGVGPVIEDGFYYDIEMDDKLTPEDLSKIEAEMNRVVKADYPIQRKEISREAAIKLFTEIGDHLKLELIRDLSEDEQITIYEQGE